MTDQTEFEPGDTPLPGLDEPKPGESQLRRAARRSIAALEAAGYLDERHSLPCQLILDLSDVIAASSRKGQAAAAGMAAAQLLAAFAVIMPTEEGKGESDEWAAFVADLRRSAAAERDTADTRSQE